MKNKQLIKDIILERNSEALFLEAIFNNALIGSAIPCGQKHVAVYDSEKCIKILMKEFNLGELEAFEQFQDVCEGSSASENKPIFFSNFEKIKPPPINEIDINTALDELT